MAIKVREFFDQQTFTMTFVVWDKETSDACIIDPVLDFNPNSGKFCYESATELLEFVQEEELKVHYILETHAHADHITGSAYLKEKLGAKTVISEMIKPVQELFKGVFNVEMACDGSQFDKLVKDGEELNAGAMIVKAIHTPGHTPACMSFLVGDNIFTGDALFMPDQGTGRCDFPAGDANALYDSITEKLYKLPDETVAWVGHDYQPGGRKVKCKTTIGASKKSNIRLNTDTNREDFVKFRKLRDQELEAPRLLLPSIQINIKAGALNDPESNGLSYLKIPMRKVEKCSAE
jgi:glyoxylase-like metal-dependent hydrolase (beta-lactamase superfamily II)